MTKIDFTKITPCGECCVGCKKKEDGICKGCIESDGNCKEWAESNGCPIYKCAIEHKVQFYGLCDKLPCDWLVNKITWNPNIVEDLTQLAKKYYTYENISKKELNNMKIRIATVDEMKALWEYSNSPTYRYFVDDINNKNIEFWTIEDTENSKLIGELYIFWDSEDSDEANGINRAYLCAFRVEEEYRGQGLSSKLMKTVLNRVKEKGFSEVTIGVDNDNYEK